MTRLLVIAVLAVLLYQVVGRPEPASIPETIMEAVSARVSLQRSDLVTIGGRGGANIADARCGDEA